eukprot:SAG31_NODE_3_length_45830_cov_42.279701_19_plen_72_part_00
MAWNVVVADCTMPMIELATRSAASLRSATAHCMHMARVGRRFGDLSQLPAVLAPGTAVPKFRYMYARVHFF